MRRIARAPIEGVVAVGAASGAVAVDAGEAVTGSAKAAKQMWDRPLGLPHQ